MKKIFYILISSVFIVFDSNAFERQDMFDEARKILLLGRNQGDYASYEEMMELYQDFKSKIKSDLDLGNPKTAIDYELLVEGLVIENYQALQSVLGFNNYHDTTRDFAEIIDRERSYQQKISYAIKQNKIAFQTTFDINVDPSYKNCTTMLNGKKLNRKSFIGPAGVSFYIGLYCPDHTFAVKEIQSSETQKTYSISFEKLKKAIYRDDLVEMGLPNPKSLQAEKLKLLKESEPPSLFGYPEFKIETGVGLDVYLQYKYDNYYIYSGADAPILLYSSSQFLYKNLELQIDVGPVSNESRENPVTTAVVEKEKTLFIRPIIAYNQLIYRNKKVFALNGDIGISTFFAGTKNQFLKPMTAGIYAGLEPKFYLWSPIFLGLKFAVSFNLIGTAQNTMISGMLRLGADF